MRQLGDMNELHRKEFDLASAKPGKPEAKLEHGVKDVRGTRLRVETGPMRGAMIWGSYFAVALKNLIVRDKPTFG